MNNNDEIIVAEDGEQKIDELLHYGVKGQKWGKRRYQNPDGSLTPEGRIRYGYDDDDDSYDDEGNSTDSEDAKKVKAIRAKSSSERSNKDIQAANERQRLQNENLRLQKEYEDLTKQPSKMDRVRNFLKIGAEVAENSMKIYNNGKKYITELMGLVKKSAKSEKDILDDETKLLKSKVDNIKTKSELEGLLHPKAKSELDKLKDKNAEDDAKIKSLENAAKLEGLLHPKAKSKTESTKEKAETLETDKRLKNVIKDLAKSEYEDRVKYVKNNDSISEAEKESTLKRITKMFETGEYENIIKRKYGIK